MEFIESLIYTNIVFSFLLFLGLSYTLIKCYLLETILKGILKQKVMEGIKMPQQMVSPDGQVQPGPIQGVMPPPPSYMG